MARPTYAGAAAALAERDPVMAHLVAELGVPRLRPRHDTHFEALVRSIVYQQLAVDRRPRRTRRTQGRARRVR